MDVCVIVFVLVDIDMCTDSQVYRSLRSMYTNFHRYTTQAKQSCTKELANAVPTPKMPLSQVSDPLSILSIHTVSVDVPIYSCKKPNPNEMKRKMRKTVKGA